MPLLKFFKIESKGVHRAALLLALMGAANGLLGLIRDRLLAGTYGASANLDVYYAAFRVPDFIFSLSLFFVASTAFIPLFLEYKERSEERARAFLDGVFTMALITMTISVVCAYFALPILMPLVAPGFSAHDRALTLVLARIMLLSPLLLGISNLVSGVLQSSKQFFAYSLSPVLYNFGTIIGILFFAPIFGLPGLAGGIVLGAVLHLAVQIPTLVQLKAVPRLRITKDAHPLQIVRYSFPRAIALSWNQLTFFVMVSVSSLFGVGAVSIFNLAYNLHTLPMTIIGLSYGVAAFPIMAEAILQNKKEVFLEHLVSASRHILFWSVPVAAVVIVLRAHIVRIFLGTGAFAWLDTRLTAASLLLLIIAMVFQCLVTLFVRAYYALGRVREPILYNIIGSVITIVIALIAATSFIEKESFLRVFIADVFRLDVVDEGSKIAIIKLLSLPFAYLIGSVVNAVLLGYGLFRMDGSRSFNELGRSTRNILVVSVVAGITARLALGMFDFITLDTTLHVVVHASIAGAAALAAWVIACQALGVREFFEIWDAIKSRVFGDEEVYQPDTEHL